MIPFLFTFIIHRPSGDLQSPRTKAAVIPALPGAYAYGLFVPDVPDATAYTLDGSESV